MKINLSPQRRDDTLSAFKAGNLLAVNGEVFDFSRMIDGDTLPRSAILSDWFAGDVRMVGTELELTLLLPLPANYSPEQAFPLPIHDVQDGPVQFPPPLPESPPEIESIQESNLVSALVEVPDEQH